MPETPETIFSREVTNKISQVGNLLILNDPDDHWRYENVLHMREPPACFSQIADEVGLELLSAEMA